MATEHKTTIPETFKKLAGFLEKERIPFVLVGGLAVSLQGEARATRDIEGIFMRHQRKLDFSYLRKWAACFASKNPHFKEMPVRLEKFLNGL